MVEDLKGRSRPYYFRRCKRERPTTASIESLPDELLFLILVSLPADYLHDRARLVCRRWYRIIYSRSFINAHSQLQQSTYELLLSRSDMRGCRPILITATQGLIETHELNYECTRYVSTCNGLVLEENLSGTCYLIHIINPATKQAFHLPSLYYPATDRVRSCVPRKSTTTHISAGIAYAAASMEFKVAQTYRVGTSFLLRLAILTVGVDISWRRVQIDHFCNKVRTFFFNRPLIAEGFMYWVEPGVANVIVTMDVETEVVTASTTPFKNYGVWFYLSTGRSLSALVSASNWKRRFSYIWELWEMDPKTKEWTKLVNDIKLGAQIERFQPFAMSPRAYLCPFCWVK